MQAEDLCTLLLKKSKGLDRFLVAIAGPPGSGKSTFAMHLRQCFLEKGEPAAVVPMDGFHLDNRILDQRDLRAKKGAPKTFDADGFVNVISRLSKPGQDIVIPLFDRSQDLAIAGAGVINGLDRILIVEGNYLLLLEDPWQQSAKFWDATVFIDPGLDVLEKRLIQRWLDHGLDPEQARIRALENDIPNVKLVLSQSSRADITLS